MNLKSSILIAFSLALLQGSAAGAVQSSQPARSGQQQQQQSQPAFDDWGDEFNGASLDESKWERFTFEGGSGGKLELKDSQLRLRSANKTRAGVRSKQAFNADRFSVEAKVAKVGAQLPDAGDRAGDLGFASLTILFDSSGRNRIEWILTSEGTFEAWAVVDGRSERLDNRKLGTKLKNPVLGLVRRGDEFLFILNGPDSPPQEAQVGLTKTIKNLPRSFRVMLYGFGSSENNWDSVRVVTQK
ncbi:MAG: hypothetical protein QOE46_1630 [Acidobacteriota bacterium]|jgi:hypothetical protein|nr:hypothetical protein [Acidobacteriota bacterium]